ncbi:MAG TPA: dTMP kinase [Longimicrobiales bacterium]|nr:dTMP kinase [Longimicrobiales bacterium]
MSGRFVVLEGLDGVGKTTQVALLAAWLDALDVPHVVVREPGGTPLGEAIRELVLGRKDLSVPPEAELLLLLAARAALLAEVVRPALERGATVLADRFALSTLAYQARGRGLDEERVRRAIDAATGGLRPDLYVLLDVPPEEARRRRAGSGAGEDRIEAEGEAFRRTVREAYLALAASEPDVEVVSGLGTPEEVHTRIRTLLEARFPESFVRIPSGRGQARGE